MNYSWPGNVRELRNLIESMVVLAHGREIGLRGHSAAAFARVARPAAADARRADPAGGRRKADGRELEFIVRSLLELKLQVEELRRRVDDDRGDAARS